ncbi:hypothetical protein ABK040_005863 [Willaertia magna]
MFPAALISPYRRKSTTNESFTPKSSSFLKNNTKSTPNSTNKTKTNTSTPSTSKTSTITSPIRKSILSPNSRQLKSPSTHAATNKITSSKKSTKATSTPLNRKSYPSSNNEVSMTPTTPFYKKQGKFGNFILTTSFSKATTVISLDKEEYLLIGNEKNCNVRIPFDCKVYLMPQYEDDGSPCIYLTVERGHSIVFLNGESLTQIERDVSVLLKHTDCIKIGSGYFYYENFKQMNNKKYNFTSPLNSNTSFMTPVKKTETITQSAKKQEPIENKEIEKNILEEFNTNEPQVQQQITNSMQVEPIVTTVENGEVIKELFETGLADYYPFCGMDEDEGLFSPPPKTFSNYHDTPSRKEDVERHMKGFVRSNTPPYKFQLEMLNEELNSSNNYMLDEIGERIRGKRKSVSFAKISESVVFDINDTADISKYKVESVPLARSPVDVFNFEERLNSEDSTISFGISSSSGVENGENHFTTTSNICQVINVDHSEIMEVDEGQEEEESTVIQQITIQRYEVNEITTPKKRHSLSTSDISSPSTPSSLRSSGRKSLTPMKFNLSSPPRRGFYVTETNPEEEEKPLNFNNEDLQQESTVEQVEEIIPEEEPVETSPTTIQEIDASSILAQEVLESAQLCDNTIRDIQNAIQAIEELKTMEITPTVVPPLEEQSLVVYDEQRLLVEPQTYIPPKEDETEAVIYPIEEVSLVQEVKVVENNTQVPVVSITETEENSKMVDEEHEVVVSHQDQCLPATPSKQNNSYLEEQLEEEEDEDNLENNTTPRVNKRTRTPQSTTMRTPQYSVEKDTKKVKDRFEGLDEEDNDTFDLINTPTPTKHSEDLLIDAEISRIISFASPNPYTPMRRRKERLSDEQYEEEEDDTFTTKLNSSILTALELEEKRNEERAEMESLMQKRQQPIVEKQQEETIEETKIRPRKTSKKRTTQSKKSNESLIAEASTKEIKEEENKENIDNQTNPPSQNDEENCITTPIKSRRKSTRKSRIMSQH